MPFDGPIGYFFTVIWQSTVSFLGLLFLGCIPPFAFGAFLLALTFAKDWKGDLRTINKMAKTELPKADILKRIDEFLRSYSNMTQLSHFVRNFLCILK